MGGPEARAGTMNLTDPQTGSDLVAVRTKALPQADGSFRLHGQKIFITYGENDRAPGARAYAGCAARDHAHAERDDRAALGSLTGLMPACSPATRSRVSADRSAAL
jgi:alkylation response protein AidB-like acyl-CoA dehydrogenase